ncbi:MAG: ATP-binding protein [Betaproteobacteria bacterium SG8_40]|nr:MAG: ATP-binding protein [Betaproteobacteria bacterium SG8_40]
MAQTEESIREALAQLIDPATGRDYVGSGEVKAVDLEGGKVTVAVELGYPAKSVAEEIKQSITEKLRQLPGVDKVAVSVSTNIVSHAAQAGLKLLPGIKNVIAVASGKGGVGKSTTTANLALALAAEGARVGILDADIYGPSQQMMMGLSGRPESTDGKTIEPMQAHGVQTMSIGVLIDMDQPMVWRGPMVTQALEQLLRDTQWKDLDYLIVDLPPGTGDIQLTLSQKVPLTGAIIVTTPQDIALIDARKALKMFEKVNVPILGIVENMSIHVCSNCGHEEHIFGEGGAQRMSGDYGVDLLGQLPLDIRIREQADSGRPTLVSDPDSAASRIYKEVARKAAAKIAMKKRDYGGAFPKIVVQNT